MDRYRADRYKADRWKGIITGAVLSFILTAPAGADEEEIADTDLLEFLEYLGSQDGKSDEWSSFFDSLPDPNEEEDATDDSDQEVPADAPA